MASIRRLWAPGQDRDAPDAEPKGLWQVRYRDAAGSERGQSFVLEREAKTFRARVETELADGDWIDPAYGEVRFGQWLKLWQQARVVARTTAATETSLLSRHIEPAFGAVPLRSITKRSVQGWVAGLEQQLAPASVGKAYRVLATVLADAVDEGLIRQSPCRGIRLPRHDPDERVFLNADQVAALVAAAPVRHQPMLMVAYLTGMRWSELAGLRVKRLDLLRSRLTVAEVAEEVAGRITFATTKTPKSRRTITLPPLAVEILAAHLAAHPAGRDDLVFRGPRGGALSRTTFRSRVWVPAVEAAGLDDLGATFHCLRHSHAASMIADGAPMVAVQRRLGHSSIRVTYDIYGHLEDSVDEQLLKGLERRAGLVMPPASGEA